MKIYSYYYGAAPGKGIGVRAQSRELENLPLSSFLNNLSSLHALESSEHMGEKLCYLLEKDGYSILGLSYTESPRESGYGYKTPCGLQYILPTVEMKALEHYYGEIVRTIEFKKPECTEPEPMARFPVDRSFPGSGCRREILAQIVDSLVKVTLSKDDILLIALPRGLASEYETARAVIGEALDYLPVPLRKKVCFLTGLPVEAGETKCLTGFENAIRLNANVVFCPNQYYAELKKYRSFFGVDMVNPTGEVGIFASYIVQSSDPEKDLSRINARLLKAPGKQPYEELNQVTEEFIEEKRREALEEAEAQKRRQVQAQANRKKISGKRIDIESSIPDVRVDRSRMDKTSQDIDIPVSGSGRNKSNSNYDSNNSGYDVSYNKKSEKQDEKENSGLYKIIPVFAMIAVFAVIGIILFWIMPGSEAPKSSIASTPSPSAKTITTDNAWSFSNRAGSEQPASPFPRNTVDSELNNCYAIIPQSRLLFRTGNSSEHKIIMEIKKGSYVWAVQTEKNEKGENWTEIYFQGKHGYVMSQYLELLSQEDSEQYNQTQKTPVPQILYGH